MMSQAMKIPNNGEYGDLTESYFVSLLGVLNIETSK